ncbi:hypothetical protein [Lysobacter soli]|uniref:hypothetical protein n=1 Tax=Lysobacter soli TaxID=453783 RepID=UPI0011C05C98|nr:hypothetical protein [Lysobacter soli]
MANRERAYSLSGRRTDLGKWKALSFGYFSLGKQRKVTRAPQAIGSLASDSSLLFERYRESVESPWMVPPFGGPEAARLRGNDGQEQEQRQDGFQLSLE